ncbi:MAG: HD domain-containing protein [Gammaproteobacteria bacterium]|nr:HD domain-containing protein [Gammaproteobacteria bacterium]
MNIPHINYHVMKDPVHGTMQFTDIEDRWIKPFIDSPAFQRLRHIKQLGMGDYIFPGAVHTRFNHCIGCCYVASQIAQKIGLAEEERQLVMIACLLHDMGHGPFSHAFEDLFHQRLIRHEDWTPYFLAEYRTDAFFQSYNQHNPRHHLTEDKFHEIESMIMHRSTGKRVLADIVSSQLDADRLDYLLRDSHFCGVAYGEFDFRWMLNSMKIIETPQGERLGLTHKGIGVVEHYLMARRLMVRNIYHHQKKLAFEYFLVQLLESLAKHLAETPIFADICGTPLGQFLLAVNQFNQTAKNKSDTTKLRETFLQKYYPLYRELCDYDVFALIRQLAHMNHDHEIIQLAKRLHLRQMPMILRLEPSDLEQAEAQVKTFRKQQAKKHFPWQMALIKTPHLSYSIDADPILIENECHMVRRLEDISVIIQAISHHAEHTTFLCIDSEMVDEKSVQEMIRTLTKEHVTS